MDGKVDEKLPATECFGPAISSTAKLNDNDYCDSDGSPPRRRSRRHDRSRSISRRKYRRRRHKKRSYSRNSSSDSYASSRSRSSSTDSYSSRDSSSSSSADSYIFASPKKYKKTYFSSSKKALKNGKGKSLKSYGVQTPRFWPQRARTPIVNNTLTNPSLLLVGMRQGFDPNDVRMGFRRKLQIFLDEPNSSQAAVLFALFIAGVVIVSSVEVIIESLPQFYEKDVLLFKVIEISATVIFTTELLLRFFAHSTSWRQFNRLFWSVSNFIDIVAVLPAFIELLVLQKTGDHLKRFTVFRLFRLIRLLHCYGYSSVLQLSMDAMFIALKKSKDALLAILFFQFFVIIVFSTILFYFERGAYNHTDGKFYIGDELSDFSSIPASFWFVSEVITTVGLGDVKPRTPMGRIISFPLMLFGLLIIALPSIVLGKNFAEAWLWLKTSGNAQKQALLKVQMEQEKLRKKREENATQKKKKTLSAPTSPQSAQHDSMAVILQNANGSAINSNANTPSMPSNLPDYFTTIEMDAGDVGRKFSEAGMEGNSASREDTAEDEVEDALDNEEANGETVQSGDDNGYFISPEALIEEENKDQILQLVQMLVEQFQHNSNVMERLATQQENVLATVDNLKKTQQKMIKQQQLKLEDSEDESRARSRSRTRSRSRSSRSRSKSRRRSRSRSKSRRRSRSRSRSRSESRGKSRSRSLHRLNSRSRSRSPSRDKPRGRSRVRSTSRG